MENVKIIAFTGHRPDKLIGGYNLHVPRAKLLAKKLTALLEKMIQEEGAVTFVSGGALGFDQIAFMCVHKLKKKHPHIRNVLAVPFKEQAKAWRNQEDLTRYANILKSADEIVYVDTLPAYIPKNSKVEEGVYSAAKMQLRNQYMVDQADYIVAAWDGTKGGTGNCVDYAVKQHKTIYCLDPKSEFDLVSEEPW